MESGEVMTIRPGDTVVAAWHVEHFNRYRNCSNGWKLEKADRLYAHTGRVVDVIDHWDEKQGVKKHVGTSVLFEDGEQRPIEHCRVLIRPFVSEVKQ